MTYDVNSAAYWRAECMKTRNLARIYRKQYENTVMQRDKLAELLKARNTKPGA